MYLLLQYLLLIGWTANTAIEPDFEFLPWSRDFPATGNGGHNVEALYTPGRHHRLRGGHAGRAADFHRPGGLRAVRFPLRPFGRWAGPFGARPTPHEAKPFSTKLPPLPGTAPAAQGRIPEAPERPRPSPRPRASCERVSANPRHHRSHTRFDDNEEFPPVTTNAYWTPDDQKIPASSPAAIRAPSSSH